MKTYYMATRSFPLRILVYSDMVGAIIGRSGSTIRSITQQTMAKIDVHRDDSPDQQEKVITITGTPDSCSEACFRIIEVIYNEKNLNHEDNELNRDIELKILAPSNLIGRLIGRSGSSIKRITEQTSTKMNVSEGSITEATGEHVIVVVGSINQVCQAEKIISSKLRAAYISDVNNSLQTLSQQPYLFNNVSLPFMPNPYAQNPVLSSLVNAPTSHGGNVIPRLPVSAHQGQMGSQMYPTTQGYLPIYPNMNVPSSAPGLLSFNSVTSSFDCERESVYIYIPSTMVGAIIGKSGAAIKEMINTSGASIKVATLPLSNGTYHVAEDKQNNSKNEELRENTSNEAAADSSAKEVAPEPVSEETPSDAEDKQNNSKKEEVKDVTCNDHAADSNAKEVVTALVSNETHRDAEGKLDSSKSEVANESTSNADVADSSAKNNSNCDEAEKSQPTTTTASPKAAPRYQNNSIDRRVTIVGHPASQYSAQYMIYRKISIESGKSDISLMVEIHVPSQLVGKIIGKGGANVKQLQKQTRTTIRLNEERPAQSNAISDNDTETSVQITGEFEGSQTAQRHIRSMIRKSLHARQIRASQSRANESATSNNEDGANHRISQSESKSTAILGH